MLPNSAISWGFKMHTAGLCDQVNTETDLVTNVTIPGENRESYISLQAIGAEERGKGRDNVMQMVKKVN